MIYTVAEAIQEFLKENNVKALSMHEEMMLRSAPAEPEGDDEDLDHEDEEANFVEPEFKGLVDKQVIEEGFRITPAIFEEWRLRFEQEMLDTGVIKRDAGDSMTGKMIFE